MCEINCSGGCASCDPEPHQVSYLDKLRLILQWIQDVEHGEMIESRNYRRTYMGFDQVSQVDLFKLCEDANAALVHAGSQYRVGNSMGEIIPGRVK